MIVNSPKTVDLTEIRFSSEQPIQNAPNKSGIFQVILPTLPSLSNQSFPSFELNLEASDNKASQQYLVFRNDVEFAATQLWQNIQASRIDTSIFSSGHLLKPNSGEFLGSFAAAKFAQAVTSSAGPSFEVFLKVFTPLYSEFGENLMKKTLEMQKRSTPECTARVFHYSVKEMNELIEGSLQSDGNAPVICLDPTQHFNAITSAAWLSSRFVDRSGLAKSPTPIASPGADPLESQLMSISSVISLGQGIRIVDDGVEGGGTLNRFRKLLTRKFHKISGLVKAFVGINTGTQQELENENIFVKELAQTNAAEKAIALKAILTFTSQAAGGQQEFRDFCLLDGQATTVAGARDYRKIKLGPFVNPAKDLGFNEELGDEFSKAILIEAAKFYSKLEAEIQSHNVNEEYPYRDFRITINDINPHVARWLRQSDLKPLPYRRISDVILDLLANYEQVKASEKRLSEQSAAIYGNLGIKLDGKGIIFVDADAVWSNSAFTFKTGEEHFSKLIGKLKFLEELNIQVGIWSDAPFDQRTLSLAKSLNISGPIIAAAGSTWTNCHGKNILYLDDSGLISQLEKNIRLSLSDLNELKLDGSNWKNQLENSDLKTWGFIDSEKHSGVCRVIIPTSIYFERYDIFSSATKLKIEEHGSIHLRFDSNPHYFNDSNYTELEIAVTEESKSRRQSAMRKISATTGQTVYSISSRYGAIEVHSPNCIFDSKLSEPNTASLPRYKQRSNKDEDIASALNAMLDFITREATN